ncbi:MAG: ATP-binding protein, partial [Bacteroidia bacterium]
YAQNEKDWRTKATNQITLSKIYFNSKYSDTKYTVEQIKIALRVLKLNLNERLPELEVDANLELARQFRSIGDYRESKECLIKAYDVVLELEKRLFSDLEAVLSSQRTLKCSLFKEKNTYAPMCLLTRSEKQKVREALFSDFQLLSVILHKVANDRLITADLAAGQTATELQLGFYQDCLRGHAHSFKNIIERLRIGIKRANIDDHFKIHPLYQALENTVRQVEGKFSELLVNNNSLITSFVSVRSLVKKMISENNYSSIFEGVSFRFDNSNSNGKLDDFSICCCPKIFENVLENLIINAARAALNSSICGMKEVKIRVLIESGTNGERSFGIFEVEDTGGDVQKLQQALKVAKQESPQNSEDRETFGLPHAVKFLQGFNGQVEVHGFQKKYTTLKIKIPIGQRLII